LQGAKIVSDPPEWNGLQAKPNFSARTRSLHRRRHAPDSCESTAGQLKCPRHVPSNGPWQTVRWRNRSLLDARPTNPVVAFWRKDDTLDGPGSIRRPRTLIADCGYDHDKYRRLIWKRGVKPIIARRQIEHGSGLGRHRWVVERTFAWLHNRRRLLIRTDRRDDIHEAFLALACCLICWQQFENSSS